MTGMLSFVAECFVCFGRRMAKLTGLFLLPPSPKSGMRLTEFP